MKVVLAGPWLGEFGWEVATWIPALRKYSRNVDRIIAVCPPGHEYLYEDFAYKIIPYKKSGLKDRWLFNGKRPAMPGKIRKHFPDTKILIPKKKVCSSWEREYIMYGDFSEKGYDLIIHARAETKYGQRSWNWPKARYRKLIDLVKPKSVCSIGTKAHYIDGTDDLRGIQMEKLCNVLSSSKVLLTPSSGPGHLASLCDCPHVIMTTDKWQKSVKGTNRDRYKRIWNPFRTPCKVLDTHNWQPPVSVVVKAVEGFLR